MEATGITDSKTGEQLSSVLYERPLDVPEHQIISLLPLKAIGYNNALNAVDAVKKAIREEGLSLREAVIKTVKLLGVTDQAVLDKIAAAEDFKPSQPAPSSSKPQPVRVREGYVPPHQRWKQQEEKEAKGIYVPPHLRRQQQQQPSQGEEKEEGEKKE
ncbi:hypothetical protein TWF696_001584 [Orbilia brochopaga]|uniref:Uncharacterized protein n=1 Tax=Orbilia brochopaga TaxID=3140254 RepID=A0AAV9U9W3_9PEZI